MIFIIEPFSIIVGICIGSYALYVYMKQKQLEEALDIIADNVNSFPTPEELAKQIIKMKIDTRELPEEIQEKLRKMKEAVNKQQSETPGYPQMPTQYPTVPNNPNLKNQSNYIG